MGHYPTLRDGEFYALLNASDGKFLRYNPSTKNLRMDDPYPPVPADNMTDYLFLVNKSSATHLTITLEAEDSVYMALNKAHSSAEAIAGGGDTNPKKIQWAVSVLKSGVYRHFYKLTNVYYTSVLSRNLSSGHAIGSEDNDHLRELWQLVHVPKRGSPNEHYASMNAAQQTLLDDKRDERSDREHERRHEHGHEHGHGHGHRHERGLDLDQQLAQAWEREQARGQQCLPGQGVSWGATSDQPSVQVRHFYNPSLPYTYEQQRESYFRLNPNAPRYLP